MKKVFLLLLAFIIVTSTMAVPISAQSNPGLFFDSAEVKPGETATLKLNLENNPGIAGLAISIKYDTSVLTLSGTKRGNLFSGYTAAKNFAWDDAYNVTSDGLLAEFTFNVAETASVGSYPVDIIVRSCTNDVFEDVECYTVSGIITVQDASVQKKQSSLIFVSKPSKLYYTIGESLDLTGMAVVTKENGIRTPVADCTVTGFDSSKVGLQKISLQYETEDTIYSNVFTIRVHSVKIVSTTAIGLATKPTKLTYAYDETLDTTGLSIFVKYSDGTTGYISEGMKVTGYDAKVPGLQRLTVTYQDHSTSFSIKVFK